MPTVVRQYRLRLAVMVTLLAAGGGVIAWAAGAPQGAQDPGPFRGVTTDGSVVPDLFPIRATGVSTEPVRQAASRFLTTLTPDQHEATTFPFDDIEWRLWGNTSGYVRQGTAFAGMSEAQREAAFAMMRAGLSARGLEKSRNIMRLNHTIAELVNNFERYGEWLYWITVMGEPSATEPWGWQLDGHHLVINYFVLGDQVVMTPTFMGSEPVKADSGRYAGTVVLQEEEAKGLALLRALRADQRAEAVLREAKTRGNALAQAFRDNLVLDHAGLRAARMDARQRDLLLDLIAEYVGNMRPGHARVRMEEVRAHLDDTWFAWIGGFGADDPFYYRVHSPVILIEFDHQGPIALPGDRAVPTRRHVHSVVRTPNGNDYGKDLLRQHLEAHRHDGAHGHQP